MKYKTIIFDLDGTIANTQPLCVAAFKKTIEPVLKREVSDEEIIATFGPSEQGTIRKFIPRYEEEGVKAYLHFYQQLHYTCPAAFKGIPELLDQLKSKGVQLAMVTGKGAESTRISLEQFGLAGYFEVLETGSPEAAVKVEGIHNVLSRLKTDVNQALYVGDAPGDIKHCKAVGIAIAAAAWAETANAEELRLLGPNYLFYTVDEFKTWLTELH
jgi:phosphoglycolate phosphatase-like HAD superfamily hydrolase